MGLFKYICSECGAEDTKIHSYSAVPDLICPACGKDALERDWGSNVVIREKGHLSKGGIDSPLYKDLHIRKKEYY